MVEWLYKRLFDLAPMRAGYHLLSGLLHHYPFKMGFETIGPSKILSPFAWGKDHAVVRLRNGASLLVFTVEHVGRIIAYRGDLDPRLSYVARRVLRPGDTMLDVGANVGWFSMVAAPLVGQTGCIHSFEPQRQLFTMFETSAMLNNFEQIVVHPFGLSDSDSLATLYVRNSNRGLATLDPQESPGWKESRVPLCEANSALEAIGVEKSGS